MLRSLKSLEKFRIQATDGDVGGVKDLLFDDVSWRVRYLVASTGSWLAGRKVLLSTAAFGTPDASQFVFPVSATKAEIEDSPGLDTHPPVTRQHELDLHRHYTWLPYWSTAPSKDAPDTTRLDSHLRSVREVVGYDVDASDGPIGTVEDFIVDDADWTVRYVVVDTRKVLSGGEVLVDPSWFDGFAWASRKASTSVDRAKVRGAPRFDADEPVNRAVEERLYDYYGRPSHRAGRTASGPPPRRGLSELLPDSHGRHP